MSIATWVISDNHIALDSGDVLRHPRAAEIYDYLQTDPDQNDSLNPESQLRSIHFSKFGSPIKCEINSANGDVVFSIYAIRNNKRWPIDIVNGSIIDHGLADNEWFYVNSDVENLQEMIKTAGISKSGKLDIGQYISLMKQEFASPHKEIENNVDSKTIAQMLEISGDAPIGLNASLYDYQKTGYLWMKSMISICHGCILGDEMGLGKTLQIIALFQSLSNQGKKPFLVIAPVSLLENWKRECAKFAPGLHVLVHHGAHRTGLANVLLGADVVVISYSTAVSDMSLLKMIKWECVVLDEAQNIKNPYSARAKASKVIPRNAGIAVTGTPFENHITDIWSLVDFSIPGLLGALNSFENSISDDIQGAKKLEPILSPVMIRRLVKDVANDLPEKVVIPQAITMSEQEWSDYEKYRKEAKQNAENGATISIALLQKLRMFCTHKSVCTKESYIDPYSSSVKYQRFCEIVEEIISRNEKVIVFTSYLEMFDIFVKDIPQRYNIGIDTINGDTPVEKRQSIVDWFNNVSGSVMLVLNPKAAGTGLNITGANHVIHYNLEWNPALEDQASARAYRRGQKKTVFVYRLYYSGTVEQVVNERIERKRQIASSAVVGTDGTSDQEDIMRALELAPEIYRGG